MRAVGDLLDMVQRIGAVAAIGHLPLAVDHGQVGCRQRRIVFHRIFAGGAAGDRVVGGVDNEGVVAGIAGHRQRGLIAGEVDCEIGRASRDEIAAGVESADVQVLNVADIAADGQRVVFGAADEVESVAAALAGHGVGMAEVGAIDDDESIVAVAAAGQCVGAGRNKEHVAAVVGAAGRGERRGRCGRHRIEVDRRAAFGSGHDISDGVARHRPDAGDLVGIAAAKAFRLHDDAVIDIGRRIVRDLAVGRVRSHNSRPATAADDCCCRARR